MDKRLILLSAIVLASGCTDVSSGNTASGSGALKVAEFSINDQSLYTGQQTTLTLILENFDSSAKIKSLELINTGALKVESGSWKERCGSSRLPDPVNGKPGLMECTWTVKAPGASELGSFKSKSYSPQLMLRYSSEFSNTGKPVKIHGKKPSNIQNPRQVTKSFSNGEVTIKVRFENPAPVGTETPMTVGIKANNNHIISDNYRFEISPTRIVSSCNGVKPRNGKLSFEAEVSPDGTVQFDCMISPDSSVTRNLILSTSYKYQKSPSLSVEVVKK